MSELSDRDLDVLAFAAREWRFSGAKDEAIRELFDMTPQRYYQVLNVVLDKPEALPVAPGLVNRLRRQRAERQRTRSVRNLLVE